MSLLEVRDLQVRYGGIAALRGFSFSLEPGELLMVTGPNGAGKSTLTKAIAGLVKPQGGHIVFADRAITGKAPESIAGLGISMVPEGRQVFGAMTVLENLKVGTGMRRDRRAVAADLAYLLDVFPMLAERSHSQAGLLSGGQQQMLAIGRALMTAPKLLVIDEPSLGLAPKVTDQVYDALLRLRRERELTLLVVEQSSTRAVLVGGRMLMLREGRTVLEGDARTLSSQAMQHAYFGIEPTTEATP